MVALIGGCKKYDSDGTNGICPVVLSSHPTDLATNVPLDDILTVTFNTEMDASTFTSQSFTLNDTAQLDGTISYNASTKTVSFDPISNLKPNTTYTGRVTTSVKDEMGNALQTDFVWTFSTGSVVVPMVIATDPENNDSLVFLNKIITATFSVPMDSTTLNSATFTLKQGATPIPGAVSYSGVTAFLDPTLPLSPNTTYTATISQAAKSESGTPLSADYVWTFKTGSTTAPTVITTDPANNESNVALNKIVTATFSVSMDPATLNQATFTIKQGSTPVTGVVTYSGNTATFTPASNFLSGKTYTATITTGAKNQAGTSLANDYVWIFNTVSTVAPTVINTDPFSNATGVVVTKKVSATFSMAMDPLTINATSFTLKQGANQVLGTVSYGGSTALFSPASNLLPGTTYTATITTAAKSASGIAMTSNYVWTFTTVSNAAPIVTSNDPIPNASGVPVNKTISANFSVVMDPVTLNNSTFTLKQGANSVLGVVNYSGTTVTLNPASDLLPGTTYTARITTGAKSSTGVPLASDHVWTFTTANGVAPTVTSTDPIPNASNVSLNKTLTANFSMAMDQSTINDMTFLLKQGANAVSGSVSYNGTTATFNPTGDLLSGSTYTATIKTGAKSASGTPLVNDYVWSFSTQAPAGGPMVDLKSALRFGIFAGTSVNNDAGFSQIRNMDVGISPGVRSSVTGFPPAIVVNGAIHASDDVSPPGIAAVLTQARQDLTDAYLFAEAASNPAPATVSGDLGGTTLAPGIYKTTSTLLIQSGDLTLDAQGDVNAVWIFQIASGFTTVGGAGGNVILINGANAANIFWQTGSSATIGDFTSFKGNILALTSITMNSGATATGRMLARNGSVVMTNTNIINKP